MPFNLILFIVFSNTIQIAQSFLTKSLKDSRLSSSTHSPLTLLFSQTQPVEERIVGSTLSCRFDGFGYQNLTAYITLKSNSEATFSGCISAFSPGFWRILQTESSTTIEITHPIQPEYMFFFDIWEDSILWTGNLATDMMTISNGLVTTNKKFIGIFPYKDTLAKFDGIVIPKGERVPPLLVPKFSDQRFRAPEGFESPYDMKRFPELFDPEFVDYFFACEEALANGKEAPPRPKPYFVPMATRFNVDAESTNSSVDGNGREEISGKNFRTKSNKAFGSDKSDKAFGSNSKK